MKVNRITFAKAKTNWDQMKLQSAMIKATLILEKEFLDQEMIMLEGLVDPLATPLVPPSELEVLEGQMDILLEQESYEAMAILKRDIDRLREESNEE